MAEQQVAAQLAPQAGGGRDQAGHLKAEDRVPAPDLPDRTAAPAAKVRQELSAAALVTADRREPLVVAAPVLTAVLDLARLKAALAGPAPRKVAGPAVGLGLGLGLDLGLAERLAAPASHRTASMDWSP